MNTPRSIKLIKNADRRERQKMGAVADAVAPTITALRDELTQTRETVIELLPPALRDILWSHQDFESGGDTIRWPDQSAYRIAGLATILPRGQWSLSDRANCPLGI